MTRLAMIVLVFMFVTTFTAWAESPDPREDRPGPPPPRGDRGPGPGPDGPGPPPRGTPFERDFFPPELVLRNQIALGLTPAQLDAVKKLINETYAKVLDLQTDLDRVTEQFKRTIEPARVDEAAALAQADQMLNLEVRVKRAQLTLLVRVKNLLTEAQQDKLRGLRSPRRQEDER